MRDQGCCFVGVLLPLAVGVGVLVAVLTGRFKDRATGEPIHGAKRTRLLVAGSLLIAVGLLRLAGIGS